MSKIISAKELHSKGAFLREQDKHEPALEFLTRAIVAYQKEGNYEGLVDALKDRVLTWKHHFLLTDDKVYAILALKDSETMLSVAKEYKLKNKFDTAYFRLGEIAILFEDFPLAIKYYNNSLKFFRGCAAEKGDFRYHLGEAVYRNGQKGEGKKIILQGLGEIIKGSDGTDPFQIHVWESGCHMRLAELLIEDEPKEALKHYKEANTIAQSDTKLVIRKRQIKELGKKLKIV